MTVQNRDQKAQHTPAHCSRSKPPNGGSSTVTKPPEQNVSKVFFFLLHVKHRVQHLTLWSFIFSVLQTHLVCGCAICILHRNGGKWLVIYTITWITTQRGNYQMQMCWKAISEKTWARRKNKTRCDIIKNVRITAAHRRINWLYSSLRASTHYDESAGRYNSNKPFLIILPLKINVSCFVATRTTHIFKYNIYRLVILSN